ncbi:hypothetical protein BsWGS_04067 [Bradybaena similaris]
MLSLWVSLLLMAYCTLLTWPVTCGGSAYFDSLNYDIGIAQIKQRILKGLNRSEPPHINMAAIHKSYTHTNTPRMLFLSSQAPDVESKDVVSFQLSSCVCSHILEAENVILLFIVRSVQRPQHPWAARSPPAWDRNTRRHIKLMKKNARLKRRLQKCKHNLKRISDTDNERVEVTGGSQQSDKLPNSQNNTFTLDQLVNTTLFRSSETSVSPNDTRLHRVKIVVRVLNTTIHRKRNIAVMRMEVKAGMQVIIPVPMKHVRRAAAAGDQTLSVQIVCRGCSQHAWIEGVYKRHRRHGRNKTAEKMLNINRPILLIDMRNGTCTDQAWSNLQPEAYSTNLEWANISQSDTRQLPKRAGPGQLSVAGDSDKQQH